MVKKMKFAFAPAMIAAVLFVAVLGSAQNRTEPSAGTPSAQDPAKKFTVEDLKKLRWIEGTWRGTGEGTQPFFERYRFEDETTLAVETFENEKLEKITDTTRFELQDGAFGGGSEGSRWEAKAIDDKSVTFLPVAKARNTFRWETVDKDTWKAVLNWPANADKPARERTYKMERFVQKTDF
jgi:hypothetical protein